MSRIVIVSDLHVDTWSQTAKVAGADGRSQTMLKYFNDFLDWCVVERNVDKFIIAGDLVDSPAEANCNAFTCANPIGKAVFDRLEKLAKQIDVTYIVGNHDIGLNELTYIGMEHLPLMPSVSVCYPGCTIDRFACGLPDTDTGNTEKTEILINHGHLCDPALALYENDLAHSIFFDASTDTSTWMHVGATIQPSAPRLLASTAMPPIAIAPGQTAYQAARVNQDSSELRAEALRTPWSHGGWLDKPSQEFRRRWWWAKGLDAMDAYVRSKGPKASRVYMIQGHTHLIDARGPEKRSGVDCYYLNIGTWQEGYGTAGYVEVDASGHCWLQDWIREPMTVKTKAPKHPI